MSKKYEKIRLSYKSPRRSFKIDFINPRIATIIATIIIVVLLAVICLIVKR